MLVFGVQLLGLTAASSTPEQATAVLRLLVNTEDEGDTFALVSSDGDVMLPRSTLTDVGLQDVPPGEPANGEPYVSLQSLSPDVTFELDAQTGTLSLTVEPGRFAPTTLDYFFNQPPDSLVQTATNSAFLNYGMIVADADSILGTAEIAGMWKGWLGQSSFDYSNDDSGGRFARLLTSLTHDSTEDQRRITLGDVPSFSGLL